MNPEIAYYAYLKETGEILDIEHKCGEKWLLEFIYCSLNSLKMGLSYYKIDLSTIEIESFYYIEREDMVNFFIDKEGTIPLLINKVKILK